MKYTKQQVEQPTDNLLMEVSEVQEYKKLLKKNFSDYNYKSYKTSLKDLCSTFGMKPSDDSLVRISAILKHDKLNIDRKLFLLNELEQHAFLIGSRINIGILSINTLETLYKILQRKIPLDKTEEEYYATS